MIVALENSSETLWLPIFSLNDRVYESPIYLVFAVFQLILFICTAYILLRTCSIFLRIQIFHENKNYLMAFFLCQWFEAIVAKAVILPYQIGLVVIGNDPLKSYYSWWSVDKQDMVFVKNTQEILPLYLASYVFRHYMFSMFFGIMAIGFERACATYYIQDYECVHRRHIPVFLIIFVNIATLPYVYFVIHNKIPFLVIYGHWALCIIMVFVGYVTILRINIVYRNQLKKDIDHRKYCLARKFQVEENIRSLTVARKSVYVIMIFLFLCLLNLTCLMMGVFVEYKTVFVHILELLIVLPALVMSISLLLSCPAWKEEFLKKLPIIGKYRNSRVGNYDFRQKQSIVSESEVYFEQLKSSWN